MFERLPVEIIDYIYSEFISPKTTFTEEVIPELRATFIFTSFLTPVDVSEEMSRFAGWKPKINKSRVDITKCICDYIRINNLQNPQDRRFIIPDNKLNELLGYPEPPLSYLKMQTCITKHCLKRNIWNKYKHILYDNGVLVNPHDIEEHPIFR